MSVKIYKKNIVLCMYALLLAWCSMYLIVCICAVRLCYVCAIHLSHTNTDVIVAFTYKWFYVLERLLLYSFM